MAWFRRLYWYQRKLILSQRNVAANEVQQTGCGWSPWHRRHQNNPCGLRVWDDWLEPGGTSPCRTCHRPKIFLVVPDGAAVGTRFPALLNAGVPCLEESPRASESLCPNKSVAGRFYENKSLVPSLRSGVWYCLTELLQTGWLTRWVWRN